MERQQLNSEDLSGRQLAVSVMMAGLSPAAAVAGGANWLWVLLWGAVAVGLAWFVLRRLNGRPVFQGAAGAVLMVLYDVWAVVLAARVLSRTAERLEAASGGSPRFWLLLLMALPLFCMGWGKPAAFFRTVEILWLAMVVILALLFAFGAVTMEWRYTFASGAGWYESALTVGEIMASALFVLPYIYKVRDGSRVRGLTWLAVLVAVSAALCLMTAGIFGAAASLVPRAFFTAAGALGENTRWEGTLSILWLIPDLTLAGLVCRIWGPRRWPSLAAVLAFLLAATGLTERISTEICLFGVLLLLVLTLLLPKGKGKIVVDF